MNKPLVSIIIPVYNAKRYMKEAIDSALSQTYKNVEVLVINDGSKDNGETRKIALSYGNKIRYFEKENGGVSSALNLGIKNMKGEYFSWLSHDDLYIENKIEYQISYLKDNNLFGKKVIVYSDYDLIDENSRCISHCIKDSELLNSKYLYGILRGAINGITPLIPIEAFEECGLFDESKRCTQDYELWWEMMKKYTFIHIPQILAKSRAHSNQQSNLNPKVITEGNPMWIKFINDLTKKEKENLEGSEYNFYLEMYTFLKDTPYDEASEYCKRNYEDIEKNFTINNNILVSVIIPFFNRFDKTVKAVKSVLNQSYQNFEIILINDGSKNKIPANLTALTKNPKIKYVFLDKNAGAANARNVGIRKAIGEYIAFLDSDDEFLPNKIELQLKSMLLAKSDFSHTSYLRNDESGVKEKIESGKQNGNILRNLIYSCGIATPTVMIKKSFLTKYKLQYDSKLVIGEDTTFWLKILKHTKLHGINKFLTIVNTNEKSAAYNIEKQVLGLKTILTFVLNDEQLSKYDQEISILAVSYINHVRMNSKIPNFDDNNNYCQNCIEIMNSKSWKLTKPLRNVSKFFRALKNDGISNTFKRTKRYLKRKKAND